MLSELKSEILHEVILRRPDDSHKGNFGRVLLIGGNIQYGGAILMATQATVGSGAGLTTVATDLINLTALRSRTPEAMFVDWRNDEQLTTAIQTNDVILIGPGLGTDEFATQLVRKVLASVNKDQILIADGSALTVMAENNLTFPRDTFTVATPHQME